MVLVWLGGMMQVLGRIAAEGGQQVELQRGAKLAMLGAVLAVVGAVYVYYQCRDGQALHNFGFFLLTLLAIGCFGGLIIVGRHVRPGLTVEEPAPLSAPGTAHPAQPAPVEEPAPPEEPEQEEEMTVEPAPEAPPPAAPRRAPNVPMRRGRPVEAPTQRTP